MQAREKVFTKWYKFFSQIYKESARTDPQSSPKTRIGLVYTTPLHFIQKDPVVDERQCDEDEHQIEHIARKVVVGQFEVVQNERVIILLQIAQRQIADHRALDLAHVDVAFVYQIREQTEIATTLVLLDQALHLVRLQIIAHDALQAV